MTLPSRAAVTLGPQIWSSMTKRMTPCAERLLPWSNGSAPYLRKPSGGLWTSTQRKGSERSDWTAWVREDTGWSTGIDWLLTPKYGDVLRIDNEANLLAILQAYPLVLDYTGRGDSNQVLAALREYATQPRSSRSRIWSWTGSDLLSRLSFDFEAMAAAGWIGLHLTRRGNAALHLSMPLDLNGWDCESTVWNTWVFSEPTRLEPCSSKRTQQGERR